MSAVALPDFAGYRVGGGGMSYKRAHRASAVRRRFDLKLAKVVCRVRRDGLWH